MISLSISVRRTSRRWMATWSSPGCSDWPNWEYSYCLSSSAKVMARPLTVAATPAGAERLQAENASSRRGATRKRRMGSFHFNRARGASRRAWPSGIGSRGYNRRMRYLVVVSAGLAAFALASLADVTTVEQIICKVNGEIITNLDLDHDRADLEKQLRT